MAKPSKKPKRPEEPRRSKQFIPGKVSKKGPREFHVYGDLKGEKTVVLVFDTAVDYCVVKLNTASSLPDHLRPKEKKGRKRVPPRRIHWINAWAILDPKTGGYVNIVPGGYTVYIPASGTGPTFHVWDKKPGQERPGLKQADPTPGGSGRHKGREKPGKLQWHFYSGDPGIGSP